MAQTLARRYLLLPGPGRPALLMREEAGGWTLPYVTLDRHFYSMSERLINAVRAEFGLDIYLLRAAYRHAAPPGAYADRVLAVANLSPGWRPPAGVRWVGPAEWSGLPLAVPEHAPVIADWFAEAAGAPPPALRAPWTDLAWLSDVLAWIDSRPGVLRTGPIRQIKSWSVSCLLKVPTEQGDLWFKAVPDFFPTEVGVTATLAEACPDLLPRLVAVDLERRWMLMHAFTGPLLEDEPELSRWEEMLRNYARLQVSGIAATADLIAAGCQDRRLPVMFAQFEQLLADEAFLHTVLSPDEIEALRRRWPELQALARRLAARGVPETLEHGDLHCRNVVAEPEAVRIFDWSDGCIAHPFFSLQYFLENRDDSVQGQPAVVNERLIAAYLEPWAPFAAPAELRTAVAEAAALCYVHYALSYYWYIRPRSDEDWGPMIGQYLKELIK